jgi:surface antigen
MRIDDEMLCAYLDNELSEQDRVRVQDAIRADLKMADRLAQLTSVNALVSQQAALIDMVPMPEAIIKLLSDNSSQQTSDNVIDLSRFQKTRDRVMHVLREHAALAASLALLIGFASGQLMPLAGSGNSISNNGSDSSSDSYNTALYAALDTTPSGQQINLDGNNSITARFSFQDTQSRFCRQFMLQDSEGSSENIACRAQGQDQVQPQWTLLASARSSALASSAQYQTSSGPRLLDSMLDAMMQGSALSQSDEQSAISNQWQQQ